MHSPRGSGWNSTREQDWSGVRGKWDGVQEVHGAPGGDEVVYLRHLKGTEALLTLLGGWGEAPRRHSQCLKLKAEGKEFTTLDLYFSLNDVLLA